MRQKFITKCIRFFTTKCDIFITKCEDFITKCKSYYKMRRLLHNASVQTNASSETNYNFLQELFFSRNYKNFDESKFLNDLNKTIINFDNETLTKTIIL